MSPEEVKWNRQKLAIETKLKRIDQKFAREQFRATRGWRSLMTPTGAILIAATLGLMGTAVGKWADNQIESRKQQTALVLKASEVSTSGSAEEQKVQRAANLLWFVQTQTLSLSDEVLADLRQSAGVSPGQLVPPPTIVPSGGASPEAPPRPNYSVVAPPRSARQTEKAYKLLQLAVEEINKNVDRQNTPDRIMEYWRATPFGNSSVSTPWTAAFMSWLIKQVAPDEMKLSPMVGQLWDEARAKHLALRADETPLPGDIMVFGVNGSPAHVGVVFGVSDDRIVAIAGNVQGAIHLRPYNRSGIIGYFRLRD
jgi:hypothetical protein